MKTSSLSLSIAVLAFAASTIYLAMQLTEERARSEQLVDATQALNARIAELEKARAEPRFAGSGTFGAAAMAPGATLSAAPLPADGKSGARPEVLEATAVNGPMMQPQGEAFQKMIRSQMRAHNKQMYADVATQLGLSREDASKLIDLLTDQQVAGFGISREVTDPVERQRLVDEAMRDNKAQIASLLGPEKVQLLEEYQQSIPARQELDVLARQLEGSDAPPLTADQRKRLLAALVEERQRIPSPQFPTGADHNDFAKAYKEWQEDYNARIAAQARTILNTEQYAAYDDYQKWQKEMNEQMSRARIEAGASGNVMFTATAPGVFVGEAAVVTTTSTTTTTTEKPPKSP